MPKTIFCTLTSDIILCHSERTKLHTILTFLSAKGITVLKLSKGPGITWAIFSPHISIFSDFYFFLPLLMLNENSNLSSSTVIQIFNIFETFKVFLSL